jgi:hypothetical protein
MLHVNADVLGLIGSYGFNHIIDFINLASTCKTLYIMIRFTDGIWIQLCNLYNISCATDNNYKVFATRMQFEQSQVKKLKSLTLTAVYPQLYHFYCFKRCDIVLPLLSVKNGLYNYQLNNHTVQATNQIVVLLDSIIVNYIQQFNNMPLFPQGNVRTFDFEDPIVLLKGWKKLTIEEARRELQYLVATPGVKMANTNNKCYRIPLSKGYEFIGFHSFDRELAKKISEQEQLYMVNASTLIHLTLETVQASTALFFTGVHCINANNLDLDQVFVVMDNNLILVWFFNMLRYYG